MAYTRLEFRAVSIQPLRRFRPRNSCLYDLVHPLFLNSMGELGTENRILSLLKRHPELSDKELIKKSNVTRGTFYKYKKILRAKDLI